MTCKHAKKKNSKGEWTLCSGVKVRIVASPSTSTPAPKKAVPLSQPTKSLPTESMATKRVNAAANRIERRQNLRQAQAFGRRIRGY